MTEPDDADFEAARERGRLLFETEPHARSARYDSRSGMTVVELYNGCTFTFPTRKLQGLQHASDDDLSSVEVIGVGYGLHWPALDADFTVPGLMAGRFGSIAYMARERAALRDLLASKHASRPDAA